MTTEKKFHFNINNKSYSSDSSEDNDLKTNINANDNDSDDSFELILPSTFTNNKKLSLEASPNYVRSHTYKTDNFHTVQKMKGGKHSVFYQQNMMNSSSSSSMDEDIPVTKKNASLSSKKKVVSYSSSSEEEDVLPVKTKETNMNNTFLKFENQLTIKSNGKNLSSSNIDKEIYRSANSNNSFKNEKKDMNKFDMEPYYHAILKDDIKKVKEIEKALIDTTSFDWHCRFKGFSRPRHHHRVETVHKFIPIDGMQFAIMEGMLQNTDENPKVSLQHLKMIVAERTIGARIERKILMQPKTLVDQNMDVKDYKHSTPYGSHVRVYEISDFIEMAAFFDARGHTKIVDLKFNHPLTNSSVSALFIIDQIEGLTGKKGAIKYYIHQSDDKLPTIILSFNKANMTLRQLWVFYGKIGELEDLDSKNEFSQFLKQFTNL